MKEENKWIDVHDDKVMREMGFFRPFDQTPRDPSVWQKTPKEHRMLRNVKHTVKKTDGHFHSIPPKRAVVKAKLIIQLKPNKIFPKSTYSEICTNSRVEEILGNFRTVNRKTGNPESLIKKYFYNGKMYSPNEFPAI